MATAPLEQVLLKLGIDLSPARLAGDELKKIFAGLNQMSADFDAKAKTGLAAQKTLLDELKLAAQNVTASSKLSADTEKLRLDILQKETAELKLQTLEIQRHLSLYNQIVSSTHNISHGGGNSGGGQGANNVQGTLLSALTRGLFGRGLVGGAAGGLVAGAGIGVGITAAYEGITKFVEKLKEASIEAGKLSQVSDTFERIARGAGVDASAQIEKMRASTEGLVDKLTLMRVAEAGLHNSYKLSGDQIAQVTGDVLKLAEAAGKDGPQAVQRLIRTFETGRISARALGIGINDAELRLKGLPNTMGQIAKSGAQMQHAFEVIHKKAEEMGEIPQTFEQMIRRMSVATKDVVSSFGKGFNESDGIQALITSTKGSIQSLEKTAESLGKKVGDVFGVIGVAITGLGTPLKLFGSVLNDIATIIGRLVSSDSGVEKMHTSANKVVDAFKAANPILYEFLHTTLLINAALEVIAVTAKRMSLAVKDAFNLDQPRTKKSISSRIGRAVASLFGAKPDEVDSVESQWNSYWDSRATGGSIRKPNAKEEKLPTIAEIWARPDKAMAEFAGQIEKNKNAKRGAIAPSDATDEISQQQLMKTAQLRMKLQHELEKIVLDAKKADIATEREFELESYQDGEVDLKTHLDRMRALVLRDSAAKVEEIKQSLADERDVLEVNKRNLTPEQYKLSLASIQGKEDSQIDANSIQTAAKIRQLDKQQLQDDKKAKITAIQEGIQAQQDANAESQAINEQQYKQGMLSLDEYLEAKRTALTKAAVLEIALANAVAGAGSQSDATKAETAKKVAKIWDNLGKQTTLLSGSTPDLLLQSIIQEDQAATSPLRSHLGLLDAQQSLGAFVDDQRRGTLGNLRDATSQNRSELMRGRQVAVNAGDASAVQKFDVQIDAATLSLAQYDLQIQQLTTAMSHLVGALGEIGNAVSANFHSKFAQNLAQEFGSGISQIGKSTVNKQKLSGSWTNGVPISGINKSNIGGVMSTFADHLTVAVSALSDFASNLLNAKSAIAGAFGGATGGFGLGQSASGLLGSLNSTLGTFAGPIGAVAGAAVGAVMGQKQATVTDNINKLQTSFKNIMNDFAQNTNDLQNTLTNLTDLLAQARAMQASSKKGSAQYQQVIDQYTQQIVQLQNQQLQIIRNLNEQLAVLSAPVGMQTYLSSLDDIIKKYQQFEGAAQNATDLANANDYLVKSLQAYEFTMNTDYQNANVTAINDALQLNQLLYDRQQLINQLNTGIEGILSQGNLTRQATSAQTKGQQIAQLEYSDGQQLDQINQQIALTQFKLQTENQIFNLAATKIGLEAQLLQIQESQAATQLQNIQALKDLLVALQSGNTQFGPLVALLNSIPSVTNPAAGATGNAAILDALIAAAYADRASLGYGTFTGQNL
jgi:hypothetical protein